MNERVDSFPRSVGPRQHLLKFFLWLGALLCYTIVLLVFFWPTIRAYLQSAAILSQLNGQPVPRVLNPIASLPITTKTLTISSSAGPVAARLYTPVGRTNAPGLVLIPGIHYLGMDEPRLIAFARSMAACGLQVLTPELPDSRDYRIVPSDVQAIGDSVAWLHNATGQRVGLMALSFSGGLALMAAAQPQYSNQVSFVFSVGAHDDLYRVASFYVSGADPLPSGDVERIAPNNYGPMILEYEHLEDFIPATDLGVIRDVFRARLQQNPALEKQLAGKLTSTQQSEYAQLLDIPHQVWLLSISNKKHADEMAAVSPHGHLSGLKAPVYLLHGRGDNLIPFVEALWLEQDLPPGTLAKLLVSPLIAHVGTTRKNTNAWDQWQLIHILAQVMKRATKP